jgi:hypothetical protein
MSRPVSEVLIVDFTDDFKPIPKLKVPRVPASRLLVGDEIQSIMTGRKGTVLKMQGLRPTIKFIGLNELRECHPRVQFYLLNRKPTPIPEREERK